MTNAIEQTKREMYEHWKSVSKLSVGIEVCAVLLSFETAFEAHLEELRKALVAGNAVIVECAQHSAESFVELERRLDAMTEQRDEVRQLCLDSGRAYAEMKQERDDIQLRLHAVDHAYCESQNTVGRQMSTIASLQDRLAINVRAEREAGTSGQVCADRGASEQTGASMAVVMDAVRGAQDIMVEYLVPDGIRAKRAMTKLIPLLDNEKLYSALYELEHEKA